MQNSQEKYIKKEDKLSKAIFVYNRAEELEKNLENAEYLAR